MTPRTRRARTTALLVAALAAPAARAAAGAPGPLTPEGRDKALRWVREVLGGRVPAGEAPSPAPYDWTRGGPESVAVTLFRFPRPPLVGFGEGAHFGEALAAATKSLKRAAGGGFRLVEADPARLRIDRLGPRRRLGPLRSETLAGPAFRPGATGLWLDGEDRRAVWLPYEVALRGLVAGDRVDGAAVLRGLLEDLGPRGVDPARPLEGFSTRSFLESAPGVSAPVSGLLPAQPRLSPASLRRGIERAGTQLLGLQTPGGAFVTRLDPRAARSPGAGPLLEQARVLRGLAALARVLPVEHPLRGALRRGYRSWLTTLTPRPKRDLRLAQVAEVVETLAAYPASEEETPVIRRGLRAWGGLLRRLQRLDGSWYLGVRSAREVEPPVTQPRGPVARATAAMTRLASRLSDPAWGLAAHRSAARLAGPGPARLPDPDRVLALARAGRVLARRDLAAEAYRGARALLESQVLGAGDPPEDRGGFRDPAGRVSLARAVTYGEALDAARRAAWRFGFDPRPLDAGLIRLGTFLLRRQVGADGGYLLARPDLAAGGFPRGLADLRQRVDLSARALGVLLDIQDALEGRAPVPALAGEVAAATRRAG